MKNSMFLLLSALLLAAFPAAAQTEGGSWEFSLAGNVGSTTTSSEYTYGGQTRTSDGEAQTYLGLDLRVGAYVVNGFSLEPEVYLLAVDKVPPTWNLGANASYTFTIPESPVKPFITAGYGIGNGIPLMQRLFNRSSDDLDIPVLRVGGGVKVFFSRYVALKAEYRYERYSQENSYGSSFYSSTTKYTFNFHNVLFGFSVFLPSAAEN